MKREIVIYELRPYDGGDGRNMTSSGILTTDPELAKAWEKKVNGNSAHALRGFLISSLDEISAVNEAMDRARALMKLTARERALLGIGENPVRLPETGTEALRAVPPAIDLDAEPPGP